MQHEARGDTGIKTEPWAEVEANSMSRNRSFTSPFETPFVTGKAEVEETQLSIFGADRQRLAILTTVSVSSGLGGMDFLSQLMWPCRRRMIVSYRQQQ